MDYSSADMVCVLKVNTKCEGCKIKVIQILQRIRGVYNITIDGEEGTVKVIGRVDPSTLLRVLEKYGKHAEVKYVKFDGEVMERRPSYYGNYGYTPCNCSERYSSYPQTSYPHQYQQYSQPPPPYLFALPVAPFQPQPPFQSQPPHPNHHFGPPPFPQTYWRPPPPPRPFPTPHSSDAPLEEPKQSKNQCTIL